MTVQMYSSNNIKQEVLRRTNCLLFFDDTDRIENGNIRRGHKGSVKFEMGSGAMIHIPTFIKTGSGIEI
jgi:hypothetical protein